MQNPSLIALLPKLRRNLALARRAFNIRLRGGWEQGGYVHDTSMAQLVSPFAAMPASGTWTFAVGAVADTYKLGKTAGAATTLLVIPILPLQNSVALKGSYLSSIDMWWINGTAALTTLTPVIQQATIPANAAPYPATVAPAFTYDAGHLNNAARVSIAQHTMTLSITAPFWIPNTMQVYVELTLVDPGTSVFDFYGARANFTLRM